MGVYEFNPPENYDEESLRGDHILHFKVHLPDMQKLPPEQLDLLNKFLERESDASYSKENDPIYIKQN